MYLLLVGSRTKNEASVDTIITCGRVGKSSNPIESSKHMRMRPTPAAVIMRMTGTNQEYAPAIPCAVRSQLYRALELQNAVVVRSMLSECMMGS